MPCWLCVHKRRMNIFRFAFFSSHCYYYYEFSFSFFFVSALLFRRCMKRTEYAQHHSSITTHRVYIVCIYIFLVAVVVVGFRRLFLLLSRITIFFGSSLAWRTIFLRTCVYKCRALLTQLLFCFFQLTHSMHLIYIFLWHSADTKAKSRYFLLLLLPFDGHIYTEVNAYRQSSVTLCACLWFRTIRRCSKRKWN